ncbi:O-antigen ligase family protein [Maribacter sp. Asnod2-G09]|uniref:O-antigen ligase family protein n=1 Tax=Maribacter sp. Asnod2-G09 TaxID=3160577 RepID=UPI00386497A2
MKKILLGENIFLSLTLFFLPISIGLSSLTLAFSLAYAIYTLVVNFKILNKYQKIYLGISFFFFLLIFLNSFFTDGYKLLLKYLPLMFIPIISMPIIFDRWKKASYLRYLNYGILFSVLISIGRYLFNDHNEFTYRTLEILLNVHPTYYSLFLLISINHFLFGTDLIKRKNLFLLLFFIGLVVFIRSRIALISLVVIGFIYLLYSFKSKKAFIGVFLFLGLLTTSLFVSGTIKGKTTFKLALTERIQIWESSYELVKEKPLLGYGIDEEFNELGRNFLFNGKLNLLDERFNSHNIFLSILIQIGVLGLLIGLIIFIFPLIKRPLSVEFLSYLIIIGICGLTESYIHRHWGIIIVLITGVYAVKIGVKH